MALLLDARAQVSPASSKEVSLRFTVFALGGVEGVAYRPRADKPPCVLKFYTAYRSAEYSYKGAPRLVFFDENATGENAAPIAIYDIPEGAKSMLLLFSTRRRATAAGLKYDVRGFDDGVEVVPAGHFRTINLSGREYVGLYGVDRFAIPEGVGATHPGRGTIALRFAAWVDGKWMPTGIHEFTMSPRDRVTLIFYPPSNRAALYPLVRRLTETMSAPTTGKKGQDLSLAPGDV